MIVFVFNAWGLWRERGAPRRRRRNLGHNGGVVSTA
jgi:hypothetical protein